MSRKVTVLMQFVVTIDLDDGTEVSDALNDMDYSFSSDDFEVVGEELVDWNIFTSV